MDNLSMFIAAFLFPKYWISVICYSENSGSSYTQNSSLTHFLFLESPMLEYMCQLLLMKSWKVFFSIYELCFLELESIMHSCFFRTWCWCKAHSQFQGMDSWNPLLLNSKFMTAKYLNLHFIQGYLVGNGVTDEEFDGNALVPFAHGMGLIPDELFEVSKINILWWFMLFPYASFP